MFLFDFGRNFGLKLPWLLLVISIFNVPFAMKPHISCQNASKEINNLENKLLLCYVFTVTLDSSSLFAHKNEKGNLESAQLFADLREKLKDKGFIFAFDAM
jgi:hypothetical protein